MKRFAVFLTALLLILSAAGRNLPSAENHPRPEGAHLSPDSTSVDLGMIPGDTVAETILRFTNTGSAPLQILSVFSDCGCTSTSHTVDSVDPGAEGEILIRFNPKGRLPGAFRKTLRIRSNADNPRVAISVKGYVKEPAGHDNYKN